MNTLVSISNILSKKTSIFIIIVAIITYFYQGLFEWVRGDTQALILGFIMLTMGMTLKTDDFKILLERPWDFLVGTLAQFTIMPLLAYTLTHIFNLPLGISVGLLLVGCSPGGVSSNIMSFLCKGDVAYSVGLTSINTLLSPVVTPALLLLLTGESIEINACKMFINILFVTLIPVLLGFGLNYSLSDKPSFVNFQKVMPGFSVIGLACIVGGVVSQYGDYFVSSGIFIFIVVFCHNSIGYIIGYTIGNRLHFSKAKNRTLSIEIGMQNAGLATNLATTHFPTCPEAAVVSAISCVWHSISGTILANIFVFIDNIKKDK